MSDDCILNFGKYRGMSLYEVPSDYLLWLSKPILKSGDRANIPEKISILAASIIEMGEAAKLALSGKPADSTRYVIERLGDIRGETIHGSFDDAIKQICREYPISADEDGEVRRRTPDQEDDRILIWEILPSGHRKVVWHFSGWHWDGEEYGDQGALPGDANSLYGMAEF